MKDEFTKQLENMRSAMVTEAENRYGAIRKLDDALQQTDDELHEMVVGVFVRHRQRVAATFDEIHNQCVMLGYVEPDEQGEGEPGEVEGVSELPPLEGQDRPRFLSERIERMMQ